jgi:hypothetical protein
MSKADLKKAKEIAELLKKDHLTSEERERVFNEYDPSYDSVITEKGIFFTPLDLAMDAMLMSYKAPHMVDVCSGIGGLAYSLLTRDYYHGDIDSITLIEQHPRFVEIAKKLLLPLTANTYTGHITELHFVQGSVWDQQLWTSITSGLTDCKFDHMVSNPPYGKMSQGEKDEATWMKYTGSEREIAAMELCWRYSSSGTFIVPPMSADFWYSGRPYYERKPSRKVDKLRKDIPELNMYHEACSVDAGIYIDQWKGTKINVEVVEVTFGDEE